MALDQLKAFILKMQDDEELKQRVLAASTADDVAKLAMTLGFEFSGDELLPSMAKKSARSPWSSRITRRIPLTRHL